MDRNALLMQYLDGYRVVALRKESVDRNSDPVFHVVFVSLSLSARRAWIEIKYHSKLIWVYESLSARRAWIEILASGINPDQSGSRSPQGERG